MEFHAVIQYPRFHCTKSKETHYELNHILSKRLINFDHFKKLICESHRIVQRPRFVAKMTIGAIGDSSDLWR